MATWSQMRRVAKGVKLVMKGDKAVAAHAGGDGRHILLRDADVKKARSGNFFVQRSGAVRLERSASMTTMFSFCSISFSSSDSNTTRISILLTPLIPQGPVPSAPC